MKTFVNPPGNYRVAVVGAGITGAVAASELAKLASQSSAIRSDNRGIANNEAFAISNSTNDSGRPQDRTDNLQVVVFDQGRRGPGGRASHRSVSTSTGQVLSDDLKNIQATGATTTTITITTTTTTTTTTTRKRTNSTTDANSFERIVH